jgi:aldehyde:ferredoxin oxidoreductase
LSTKKHWEEKPSETFYRTYLGGRALGLYYMLKEMKPKIDSFSAENKLIFATSVIVGTHAPSIVRYTVCAKSPLTGAQGESEAAGYWGPELKKAGYISIIIDGKSSAPVYLWVSNEKVEIRDANHIWGKDTAIAQDIIKKELGDERIRVALIGLAGENLVRFANISNELTHFNGRNGLGAVMGSKNLKAIAVRGHKPLKIFDEDRLKGIIKNINQRSRTHPIVQGFKEFGTIGGIRPKYEEGWLPTKNFTTGYFEGGENITAEVLNKTMLKKSGSCFACPVSCKRVVEYSDSDIKIDPVYGGPEYETAVAFGSICGVDDIRYVAKGNELCNKYNLDTISTGMTIGFAMQCFEEGIITIRDTDGLELKFGNKKAMLCLIEKIAKREGIGNILAEGTLRAAKKIGHGAMNLIHQVKGQEIAFQDPRIRSGLGLQFAFSDYGADHVKAFYDPFFINEESLGLKELSGLGILEPVSLRDIGEKKVRLFKIGDIYYSLLDILGVCVFGYAPEGIGTIEELLEIIKSITGWRMTWYELMKVGERSINMARMFNLREGFTSSDDGIPEVFYKDFKGGPLDGTGKVDREEFEKALKLRYQLMDWDKNGIPNKGKLIDLGLDWLIM